MEERIIELEALLKNVEVVDEVDTDTINIGYTVKLLDLEYDEEMTFKIVGSTEADSLHGKISNESPVGSAILHHKVGDTVKVNTLDGKLKYKIVSFSH